MTDQTLSAQWRERFDEFARSGLSVACWCVARNVSVCRFYYWRRKLSRTPALPNPQDNTQWIALPMRSAASVGQSKTLTVRIGSASIDVAPGFDPALLGQIARALESARC